MNMLIAVLAIHCYMATSAFSAPLEGYSGDSFMAETGVLVEDPQFYDIGRKSRALIDKVILAVPETHKSCIHAETLTLNSPDEHIKLQFMATKIGIPSAPTIKALSNDYPLENVLRHMLQGLQQQKDLLLAASQHLAATDRVTEMQRDLRDLLIMIRKMLKIVQTESKQEPTPAHLELKVSGQYEAQVAMHLTLVQLQAFGQDVIRSLRNIVQPSLALDAM
uniref:Granulocyte colony stimulating factor 1 n=1 Tax=Plecoglossus altivelis TaxID=61084 RepID=A0A856EAV0_PLEAT|nr:granulocyte colony stimulating factor 1 [Plecoglossus altivelis]